jgi:hypothetical protein
MSFLAVALLPATAFAQRASVTDYGATGDGSTDDTRAIQDALDAHRTVYFPEPTRWYKVSTLQLRTGHTLIGPGKWDRNVTGETGPQAVLKGDGSGILLNTGDLGAMPPVSVRRITIRDISLHNTDYPVLRLEYSPDFLIENAWIGTLNNQRDTRDDRPAIEGVESYRGTIRDCFVGQAGTSWAIQFMDDMNAVSILQNTITGGTAGNGIDVGGSRQVTISGNTLEICNGYGIRISGDANPGNGICTGVHIEGNYMERVVRPLSLGEAHIVRGATVCTNSIGNVAVSGIDRPQYGILLGRVENAVVTANAYYGSGGESEPFLRIQHVPAAGVTEIPVNCRITDNFTSQVSDNYVLQGMPNVGYNTRVMSYNVMKYGLDPPTGITRVYTSPVITRANAPATRTWALATENGGNVDRIEIIDASGQIDGQLHIGCAGAPLEILKVDGVGALSDSNGAVSLSPTSPMMRPRQDSTMSVTGMTGSGSFRVRISYRN